MTQFPGVAATTRFWVGTETMYSGARTVMTLSTAALVKILLRAGAAMTRRGAAKAMTWFLAIRAMT